MTDYKPINCSLIDYIEHFIVKKEIVSILFLKSNLEIELTTVLKDRYTNSSKEEYLVLASNEEIRLDKIKRINDIEFTSNKNGC